LLFSGTDYSLVELIGIQGYSQAKILPLVSTVCFL